ncbi:MAG: EAL domain-containing protein [Anaerolineaceae bacterium]|nr:MAG: EAL domain-containing protein [Anaerolineaceae bacterium]
MHMEKTKQKYNDSSKDLLVSKICSIKKQIIQNYKQNKMMNRIQTGIARDEFTLFYQPEYNLDTKEIIGVEALVRWVSPGKGIIPPDAFIPVAEKTDLIYELERMIICKALEQKQKWEQEGLGHIELSINLSSKSIESEDDFSIIEKIISSYKVNYNTVIFEITESAVITNINMAMERLSRLKKHGIRFALDDFGTGYSSLVHLIKLPIDIIKIDRSFISSIPDCNEETSITKNILKLAHDLNYKVVAEGIETNEQLEYLRQNSCEGGQGFFLCVPLPSEQVSEVIKGKI